MRLPYARRCLSAALAALAGYFLGPGGIQASCHDRDEDGDGVNSCDDLCPGTISGARVDARGCPCGERDDDDDGVPNCFDLCPGRDDAIDSDADGVPDCRDGCEGSEENADVGDDGCTEVFVNWESPHVHPLDLTPDGSLLLAVNTPDARLEVFEIGGMYPRNASSIFVGLDPVSVRARSESEAWVVNRISDSISVVDLVRGNVKATLRTGDEPADVVFAGMPARAFVSVAGPGRLEVFDPRDLTAPPVIIPLKGKSPRALATDGSRVYAAFFQSGNGSTVIPAEAVSAPDGPYGGRNPPPNRGDSFSPSPLPGSPRPPPVALIVRRDSSGRWLDDNGRDWSTKVARELRDNDVAVIDAATLETHYIKGPMNACMAIAIRPDGRVSVVGTDALNQIRFEPNLRGVFLRVLFAALDPAGLDEPAVSDLNPHLTYSTPSVVNAQREESLGDPRCIVWDPEQGRGFVSGAGSNNVVMIDTEGRRQARVQVGAGPTGLALDENAGRLYVLDRFEGAVSVVDTESLTEVHRALFFDPTPGAVQDGRAHFYDTHRSSGLGHTACASCHIDGRTDGLAWDLGNPAGAVKPFDQECSGDVHRCFGWHPMKGPMTTQTLAGVMGTEPFHWRGDRRGLGDFNAAFETLLGDDERLSDTELLELAAFLGSIRLPPSPFRRLDGSLGASHPNGGNPRRGEMLFFSAEVKCVSCHPLPTGAKPQVVAAGLLQEPQEINIPHLLDLYQKTAADSVPGERLRGFGFTHDGSFDSVSSLLLERGIDHSGRPAVKLEGEHADEDARDLEAFVLSFGTATHPAVGAQATVANSADAAPETLALIEEMVGLAESRAVGLVVKGHPGFPRGYVHAGGGLFQSDRAAERLTQAELLGLAAPGSELTYTLVPYGARIRLGIDRDLDGILDGDEADACAGRLEVLIGRDPEVSIGCDPAPVLDLFRRGDADGNGRLEISDPVAILNAFFLGGSLDCPDAADSNDDGRGDISDPIWILAFLFRGGPPPASPHPGCGPDLTRDELGCTQGSACDSPQAAFSTSPGLKFVLVPRGYFLMGSPSTEAGRDIDEELHPVTISQDFLLAATEVTEAQYGAVLGTRQGARADCPSCPAANVSWSHAAAFCDRLTSRDRELGAIGLADFYRLPTEAEWEYACRAGAASRFSFGDPEPCSQHGCAEPCPLADPFAWWCGNSARRGHPAGTRIANSWGLYDMHGNLAEWCLDWYGPYPQEPVVDPRGPTFSSYRLVRGGSVLDPPGLLRSAARRAVQPEGPFTGIGFRPVLERR